MPNSAFGQVIPLAGSTRFRSYEIGRFLSLAEGMWLAFHTFNEGPIGYCDLVDFSIDVDGSQLSNEIVLYISESAQIRDKDGFYWHISGSIALGLNGGHDSVRFEFTWDSRNGIEMFYQRLDAALIEKARLAHIDLFTASESKILDELAPTAFEYVEQHLEQHLRNALWYFGMYRQESTAVKPSEELGEWNL
jgi:hypothetical protein